MGNTHFFIAGRIGYCVGNTQFFIIADKTICYCLVL
nr:MAG TPA: hypothetical protein [Caudoviricetes sp.]